jgi:hypothetical protein
MTQLPQLTIFTIPKPFRGNIATIQRNAILSWKALPGDCEVILCGDEFGTRDFAREINTIFLPQIDRNEFGTPLLSSAFRLVRERAKHLLLCYSNADIIFTNDLIKAISRISFHQFVMVGQRWNIDLAEKIDFCLSDWEETLHSQVRKRGSLHNRGAMDYFVFPRDSQVGNLPPFAVGRPAWDNWFLYNARRMSIPVVDASAVVWAIHQNHDYEHVPQREGPKWEGPEADKHQEIIGGRNYMLTIDNATHVLSQRWLLPAWKRQYLSERWKKMPYVSPWTKPFIATFHRFLKVLRSVFGLGEPVSKTHQE